MDKKFSRYNTLLKVNEKFGLFYNAMSDKYIVLKAKAYDVLSYHSVEYLKRNDVTLYKQLAEVGGIVDSDVDEVRKVRDLIRKEDEDDTVFFLHVNPTVDCNFRCWYCYENHVKGSRMSTETRESIKRLIDNTISQQRNLRTFSLSFFGGEPLMFFNHVACPIIEHLCGICAEKGIAPQLHFTTNGYLFTKKIIDFFDGKSVSFQITLDGDREHHDRTRFMSNGAGSFDRIVKNMKTLALRGHDVIARINYTEANLDSMSSVVRQFYNLDGEHRRFISFDFQRVWQDVGIAADENVVEEKALGLVAEVRSQGFMSSYAKNCDRVRHSCYGDKKNYVLVNYDGKTFNCTARDFNDSNMTGRLLADGTIEYIDNLPLRRRACKFSKQVCHECRIAPICGGGCVQKAYEKRNAGNECIYGYSEKDIDDIVVNRFDYSFPILKR